MQARLAECEVTVESLNSKLMQLEKSSAICMKASLAVVVLAIAGAMAPGVIAVVQLPMIVADRRRCCRL